MPVSEQTFRRVALEDAEQQWELACGNLRAKPGMTADHNDVANLLAAQLWAQLDPRVYRLRANSGHVRRSAETYFVPDIFVVPATLVREQRGTGQLEIFDVPLPLVVEVWSPSTSQYDVETKFPEYQRRGDLEIWRLHPLDHTLLAWRRQADGTYAEVSYAGGLVELVALPGVIVNLDALFD